MVGHRIRNYAAEKEWISSFFKRGKMGNFWKMENENSTAHERDTFLIVSINFGKMWKIRIFFPQKQPDFGRLSARKQPAGSPTKENS